MDTLDNANKKCDFCGEEIFRELRRCPYCGSLLEIHKKNYTKDLVDNGATVVTEAPAGEADSKGVDFVLVSDSQGKSAKGKSTNTAAADNSEGSANTVRAEYTGMEYSKTAVMNGRAKKNTLSNGMKVFLTVISTVIPGLGQLAGIIISILFMNDEHDEDKRSFGIALLIASLVFFAISCVILFIILITFFPVGYESFN